MPKQAILKRAFWFLIITGILNWMAEFLGLYWTIWWADSLVHFFGGLTVSLVVMWLCSFNKNFQNWNPSKLFFISILGTILIGILWEFQELFLKVTALSDGREYWIDTLSDLISDIFGGFTGFLMVKRLLKKNV